MNTTPQPGQPESGRSPGPFYTCKIASLYFRQFILLAFAFASLYFCPLAKADIGWTFNQCVQAVIGDPAPWVPVNPGDAVPLQKGAEIVNLQRYQSISREGISLVVLYESQMRR
jgi:hypothetical protein